MLCCVSESFGVTAPVDEFVREKPGTFACSKSLPQPLVTVGRAGGIGGRFDGRSAIGPGMNNDLEAACRMLSDVSTYGTDLRFS
jgi:hypothetical protein